MFIKPRGRIGEDLAPLLQRAISLQSLCALDHEGERTIRHFYERLQSLRIINEANCMLRSLLSPASFQLLSGLAQGIFDFFVKRVAFIPARSR